MAELGLVLPVCPLVGAMMFSFVVVWLIWCCKSPLAAGFLAPIFLLLVINISLFESWMLWILLLVGLVLFISERESSGYDGNCGCRRSGSAPERGELEFLSLYEDELITSPISLMTDSSVFEVGICFTWSWYENSFFLEGTYLLLLPDCCLSLLLL